MFILVRKIVIPVALIVAWIGVGVFASVLVKENNETQIKMVKTLAIEQTSEEKITEEENEVKEVENLEVQNDKVVEEDVSTSRGVATSRSGSRVNRSEVPTVYYEDIGVSVADSEIEILERIVQAEAGGSGYNGMLAVANVVLNRVKSERFPNTVTEVVFAHRQFTPISDGRYYTIKVNDTARQVVKDALAGARLVGEDALYFCTPTASGKGWFETALRKIDYIAPHNFYGYKLGE
jgi:spore germination cell wall hydrolase CwlJ-like protein